jgi:hypothetical protein
MPSRSRYPLILLLAVCTPAMAQDSGGLHLAPGVNGGPVGLARPLPFVRPPLVTAQDLQAGPSPADRQAKNRETIARLRGDPGFLSGFASGAPLAGSRQTIQAGRDGAGFGHRHGSGPIIINNQGPLAVTVGNGNVVQQQSATGSGPVAQQQVATTPGAGSAGGGAVNLVTGAGNIVQRATGGH